MTTLSKALRSVLTAVVWLMSISVLANQYPRDGSRPQDLKAVAVSVRVSGPEAVGYELDSDKLRPQVEAWLKEDGFKVLTLEEWANSPSSPMLQIEISCSKDSTYSYRVLIYAHLRERVTLLGPGARTDWAVTWLYGPRLILSGLHPSDLREDFREIITRFTGSSVRKPDGPKREKVRGL
jgi:hypothetical protein